jgi:hypothetical protein
VTERDEFCAIVDYVGETLHVDLTVLVVVDHHDLGAGTFGHL